MFHSCLAPKGEECFADRRHRYYRKQARRWGLQVAQQAAVIDHVRGAIRQEVDFDGVAAVVVDDPFPAVLDAGRSVRQGERHVDWATVVGVLEGQQMLQTKKEEEAAEAAAAKAAAGEAEEARRERRRTRKAEIAAAAETTPPAAEASSVAVAEPPAALAGNEKTEASAVTQSES